MKARCPNGTKRLYYDSFAIGRCRAIVERYMKTYRLDCCRSSHDAHHDDCGDLALGIRVVDASLDTWRTYPRACAPHWLPQLSAGFGVSQLIQAAILDRNDRVRTIVAVELCGRNGTQATPSAKMV